MITSMEEFKNKVVVVTGSASGIGKAIVSHLLKLEAKIVAVDINHELLSQLMKDESSNRYRLVVADICNSKDRSRILMEACQLGQPTYLVNAAGIVGMKNIFNVTEENWDRIQNVNAKACFFMCQLFAKYWVEQGIKGSIVNFSSSAGKTSATSENAAYSASKASVISITKSFAYALASAGCRVNCVCPGIILTPMSETVLNQLSDERGVMKEEIATNRLKTVPMGREGTPEEVVKVVLFLLSEDASYMTGQSINITGGLVMY
jgi:NAD(P)-dependent dehydrogenase (short-subunit alcohol dehydrogenase family)